MSEDILFYSPIHLEELSKKVNAHPPHAKKQEPQRKLDIINLERHNFLGKEFQTSGQTAEKIEQVIEKARKKVDPTLAGVLRTMDWQYLDNALLATEVNHVRNSKKTKPQPEEIPAPLTGCLHFTVYLITPQRTLRFLSLQLYYLLLADEGGYYQLDSKTHKLKLVSDIGPSPPTKKIPEIQTELNRSQFNIDIMNNDGHIDLLTTAQVVAEKIKQDFSITPLFLAATSGKITSKADKPHYQVTEMVFEKRTDKIAFNKEFVTENESFKEARTKKKEQQRIQAAKNVGREFGQEYKKEKSWQKLPKPLQWLLEKLDKIAQKINAPKQPNKPQEIANKIVGFIQMWSNTLTYQKKHPPSETSPPERKRRNSMPKGRLS